MILLGLSLTAGELRFEHDFKTALQKAKEQKKEVMMIYSAVWCPECSYMKEVAFKDKALSEYIQTHYVVLSLDIEKDKLPEGFDYPGLPTFFFLDDNGKEQHKVIGGDKAGKFLKRLEALR